MAQPGAADPRTSRAQRQPVADERTALLASHAGDDRDDEAPTSSSASARFSSSNAAQARPRSSYIIVTAPTLESNRIAVLDEVPQRPATFGPPPRFRLLLPVFALADLVISIALFTIAYEKYDHPDPGRHDSEDAAAAAKRLALSLLSCAVFRAVVFAGVGFSKHTRHMGVLIAATCLLSTLFVMSVANMLLEAHALRSASSSLPAAYIPAALSTQQLQIGAVKIPELPIPVLPLFTGQQLLFTILEWAAFIAVVGVRLPPGRNPVQARRWARTLHHHYSDGIDARSLHEQRIDSGSESEGHSDVDENEHVQQAVDFGLDGRASPDHIDHERQPVADDTKTVSSSIRPIAPQSPTFPMGSPSPAPSLNVAPPSTQALRTIGTATGAIIPQRQSSTNAVDLISGAQEQHGNTRSATPDLERQLAASQLALPPSLSSPRGAADVEDDEDEQDPNDIIDIPFDKQLSRQESRRRLAKAYARSNASSSSINIAPSPSGSSARRSMTGNRRDSAASIRSTSTATGMGLPISTPSVPDRRTSTNFRTTSPTPPIVAASHHESRDSPRRGRASNAPPQSLLKNKSGKLGIGLGLGRRPSWLGGPKKDDGGSGSVTPRQGSQS